MDDQIKDQLYQKFKAQLDPIIKAQTLIKAVYANWKEAEAEGQEINAHLHQATLMGLNEEYKSLHIAFSKEFTQWLGMNEAIEQVTQMLKPDSNIH